MQSDFRTKGYLTQAFYWLISRTIDSQVTLYLNTHTMAKSFLSISCDSITTELPFCRQQEAEAASRFQTHETAEGRADTEAASQVHIFVVVLEDF